MASYIGECWSSKRNNTRKIYHAAEKLVLNSKRDIRNSNLAGSFLLNCSRPNAKKFWSDVKRLNTFPALSVAYDVSSKNSGLAAIAIDFKDIYKDIKYIVQVLQESMIS